MNLLLPNTGAPITASSMGTTSLTVLRLALLNTPNRKDSCSNPIRV